MEITMAVGCKISCPYCGQKKIVSVYKRKSNITTMSFDVFKTCVDKIPLGVGIIFSGFSEPWQNPDCTRMLLYAHKKGHKIVVHTTLFGMSLNDIDLMSTIPFKNFVVHFPSKHGFKRILSDESYMRVLEKISKSKIHIKYVCHEKGIPSQIKAITNQYLRRRHIYTRAGNIKTKERPSPVRMRRAIRCCRNLRVNILFPNGDVTLCSCDYGMQHVLGNLLLSDYDSLFQGEEFLRIKKGLKDDSLDIICRYCEMFAYDGGLLAAFFNPFFYFLENAKKIQNIADFYRLFWLINIKLLRRIIIMCKNQSELIIDHWRQAFHFHPKAQKPGDQIKKDFKKKNA